MTPWHLLTHLDIVSAHTYIRFEIILSAALAFEFGLAIYMPL